VADPERSPRLRYVPGLDGIRAFAVLAVMAFHNFSWLPGGFYGVDAFFVLSGYLITSLLVSEWRGSGTVRLGRFWAGRARRLLPALFVLVAGVGLIAALWPSAFGPVDLLPGAIATVFYSANWYFIGAHASYFTALGPPSPLLHTWSLAIEEQFYLVWPLVVLAVLGTGRQRWRRWWRRDSAAGPGVGMSPVGRARRLEWLFVLASVGAAASALLMAVLAPTGGATTRAYYGTDTRAQALLVGAALATAFARWGGARKPGGRRLLAGVACVGALGTMASWWLISYTSSLAFHGGFLLVSLAAAALIAGVVQAPRGPVAVGLSWAPLRALGRISYGVYLWYWPVLLVMTGVRMHADGWLLFGERVAVTVGLAAISYRFVEMPVRRGRLSGRLSSWRGLVAVPAGAGLALAVVGVATLVPVAQGTSVGQPVSAVASQLPGSGQSTGTAGGAVVAGASNAAAVAGTPHAIKVLLVGDSIAGSLGVGLDQVAANYGIELVNEGSPGCSVSMDQLIRVLWYTLPPGAPCQAGNPGALLDQWQSWVDSYNPDVVVYVARGELFDQEVGGRWSNLGVGWFDSYVAERFTRAISVLGSKGASVVLLTTPYYDSGQQPSGAPWPETDPARVTIDNALIKRVAAAAEARAGGSPPTAATTATPAGTPKVSVLDFGSLASPGGHFQSVVDGVDLRCADGVHFTPAGGRWAAPYLLPELAALGRQHEAASPGGSWPGPALPATPSWYSELPCGTG